MGERTLNVTGLTNSETARLCMKYIVDNAINEKFDVGSFCVYKNHLFHMAAKIFADSLFTIAQKENDEMKEIFQTLTSLMVSVALRREEVIGAAFREFSDLVLKYVEA
jgi:hypothetical protein